MDTVEKPMYEWEAINWGKAQRYVFKLQKRIYRASERGDVKAVRRLQSLLTKSWYSKVIAVKKVTQDNQAKNTPGIDGVSLLPNHQKPKLSQKLGFNDKSQPNRRVWISKPGKTEKRPLGIPTIEERARQALLKLALEPEWEAKFEPNSYGFRPGRSLHEAIAAIFNGICQKAKYVLEAKIEKCFDRINHQKLLDKLQTSPTFRRQIKTWLKSGTMDEDKLFPTEEGAPQGSVISPLLANIALQGIENILDERFSGRLEKRQNKISFVRYADNFVLMDESLDVILEAKKVVEEWLQEMGLTLKQSKSRIIHTLERHNGNPGFDFLGFNIRQYPCSAWPSVSVAGTESKRGYKTLIKPSKEAIQRHLKKIDCLLDKNGASSQEEVIKALNPIIRGWAAYYSTVASVDTFSQVDSILFQKLFGWAKKRRDRNQNNTDVISKYWGVNRGLGWNFCTQDSKYTLEKHQDTKIKRHVKVKGTKSPDNGDLTYWGQQLSNVIHSNRGTLTSQVIEEPNEAKVSRSVLKER